LNRFVNCFAGAAVVAGLLLSAAHARAAAAPKHGIPAEKCWTLDESVAVLSKATKNIEKAEFSVYRDEDAHKLMAYMDSLPPESHTNTDAVISVELSKMPVGIFYITEKGCAKFYGQFKAEEWHKIVEEKIGLQV
jgi:hypothetical protein